MVEEEAPKSSVGKISSEWKKGDTVDFLDELFCDPSTISRTKPTSGGSNSRKVNTKETPKQVSDSKESSAIAESSAPSQPTLDGANTRSPADVKDEDTVKSKVKKEDSESSEKVGSTNKPRRLPDWLADVTVAASSTSSSKAPASRKRKAPSSASASSTTKRTKAASPADENKDDDALRSPPPTKKVRLCVSSLSLIHSQFFRMLVTCTCKLKRYTRPMDEDNCAHFHFVENA